MAAALVPEPDIHTAQGLVRLTQTLGSASPSSSRTLKQGRVSTVLFSSVPGPEQILTVLSTCPCRILREQVSPSMQVPQPLINLSTVEYYHGLSCTLSLDVAANELKCISYILT